MTPTKIAFKPIIIAIAIVSGVLGWAIVETVFLLFSFVEINLTY